jgi:hypothetical protein
MKAVLLSFIYIFFRLFAETSRQGCISAYAEAARRLAGG